MVSTEVDYSSAIDPKPIRKELDNMINSEKIFSWKNILKTMNKANEIMKREKFHKKKSYIS